MDQTYDLVGHPFGSGQIDPLLGTFGANGGGTWPIPLSLKSVARDLIPIGASSTTGEVRSLGRPINAGSLVPAGSSATGGPHETRF